jgi:dipeptidyl aminopeptidase/acylaminoacyl peptidase
MASFVYDGPGQGECPVNGVYVTKDNHMEAAQAVYDWLIQHPNIDKDRLVIFGISFGSFFGAQAAAQLGDKVKGAALSFVCHEPGCYTIFNMAAPTFKLRFMFMANYDDEAEFDEFASEFSLDPIVDQIKCPILVQGGQDEELSPVECSEDFVNKLSVPKKLVFYEGERHAIGGGSAAYLGENWYTMLADWCLDRVNDKPAPNESVLINSLGQAEATPY